MPGKRKPQASRRRRRPRAKSRSIRTSPKARVARVPQKGNRRNSVRDSSLHALADMRRGASFSEAARDNGISTRAFKKYLGSALVQDRPGGRIRPTKSDRFVRYLQIPGLHGPVEMKAHGSKEAGDVARYKAAVNRFLRGDIKALAPWHGKKIAGIKLVTDRRALKSLAQEELLPYSLYRSLSGGAA